MSAPVESPRVALYSRRAAERRVWHASQYEFEDLIAEIDSVGMVIPDVRRLSPVGRIVHGGVNRMRRAASLPRKAPLRPLKGAFDAEIFFGMFAAPHEVTALPYLRDVLDRARTKVAFIVEMYMPDLPKQADHIRQLQGFDHIFVFTRDVIPHIEDITGVPTSFLPTGVDALMFAPPRDAPTRFIDVMSYGRRILATHDALVGATARGDLHYFYDTVHGPFDVQDHWQHRLALAQSLHRSRHTIIHRNNDAESRVQRTGGEETLSNRLFEAATAGTVILGSAPQTPDFERYFDWPDALIQVPTPNARVVDLVRELAQEPERLARASRSGTVAGLRGFDWAYRWKEVLDVVGIDALPAYHDRVRRLQQRAAEFVVSETPRS
ncbi:glycosyltransferase family protein [Microbacterium sp.]|uniref:glycosyltransferase family protein n=1 Tax=Microbacterium sp. TaxID=51671 RepID=UPI003C719DA5